jgi:hypothetical protein
MVLKFTWIEIALQKAAKTWQPSGLKNVLLRLAVLTNIGNFDQKL